jgi:hypothetical protein
MVKFVVMKKDGSIQIQEQPYPSLEHGSAVLKTAYTANGSTLSNYTGSCINWYN